MESAAAKKDSSEEDLPPLPTTPDQLFAILDELEIKYEVFNHKPIFTVAEGLDMERNIPGLHCRNLFIRDKKGKMFLVVAANETKVNMKELQTKLECGRLSFGSHDRLWQYLGIRTGSVCPFCIINDKAGDVEIILDEYMMNAELVNYHPLDNSMTMGLTPQDLIKFIKHTGHEPRTMDIAARLA